MLPSGPARPMLPVTLPERGQSQSCAAADLRLRRGQFLERTVYLLAAGDRGGCGPHAVAEQKAEVLRALAAGFEDAAVNRAASLVDWTSPTPLTRRDLRLLRDVVSTQEPPPSCRVSNHGLVYLAQANCVQEPVLLGAGKHNQVHHARWLVRSQESSWVFKADKPFPAQGLAMYGIDGRLPSACGIAGVGLASDSNLLGRNVASYETAVALGLSSLLPATYAARLAGKSGVAMELVSGLPLWARLPHSLWLPEGLSLSTGQVTACAAALRPLGLTVHAPGDGRLEFMALDERHDVMAVGPFTADAAIEDGVFKRQLCRLEWLDAICAQEDRNPTNIMVRFNEDGSIQGITGIDNDFSFERELTEHAVNTRDAASRADPPPYFSLTTPECIDEELASCIEALTADDKRDQYRAMLVANGLNRGEVAHALMRLDAVRHRIDGWRKAENASVAEPAGVALPEGCAEMMGRALEQLEKAFKLGLAPDVLYPLPNTSWADLKGELARILGPDTFDSAAQARLVALFAVVTEFEAMKTRMQSGLHAEASKEAQTMAIPLQEAMGLLDTTRFMFEKAQRKRMAPPVVRLLSVDPRAWQSRSPSARSQLNQELANLQRQGRRLVLVDSRQLLPILQASLGLQMGSAGSAQDV